MRRFVGVVMLVVASNGCDRVFGVAGGPAGDDVDSNCKDPGAVQPIEITGDATLDGTNTFGHRGSLHLSAQTRVLMRIKRPADLDRILVHFTNLTSAVDCGSTTCALCEKPTFGSVQVSLVSSDWDEATVTGVERQPGIPWTTDERISLGSFAFGSPGALRMEDLHLAGLSTPLVGDQVTFEISANGAVNAWMASREDDVCVTGIPVPSATGTCGSAAECGDMRVEADEQCDEGPANGTMTSTCSSACTKPVCGNGVIEPSEDCDNPSEPGCNQTYCLIIRCGNGVVETGEKCDDGNTMNSDACDNNCTIPACGNGIIDVNEQCDDGNTDDDDGCSGLCMVEGIPI